MGRLAAGVLTTCRSEGRAPDGRDGVPGRRLTPLLLAGAVAVGVFLRFYQLDTLPPGLWHDEAFNGIDTQRILAGEFPIIFEANHGRQPLFIYLQALAVAVLGARPEALRATAGLVGVLTIISVYFLARTLEVDGRRGRQVGLLAAGLLAVMPWHVHLSRYGLRAILFPLLVCWFLFFLSRGLDSGRWRDHAAAGVALAAAFYSYIAAVLLPPMAIALALLRLIQRPRPVRVATGTVLTLGVALVLVAPLLIFYTQHLDLAFSRPTEISLLNPARTPEGLFQAGAGNLVAAVGMFFWAGSTNWRHNLAGWPLLDPVSGALLLTGVGLASAQWRRPNAQLLLLAAGTLILPTVLFPEGLPHATRALGMAPVVAVLTARGAMGALAAADRLRLAPHNLFGPVWLILLLVVGSTTFYRYFVLWASKPEVYFAYEADVRAAAEALPELASRVPDLRAIWAVVPSPDQVVNLRFLAPEIADRVVAVGYQNELGPVPPGLLPLLYVVPASQQFIPPDLEALLGAPRLLGSPTPTGEPAFRAFLLDSTPVPAPTYAPAIQIGARLGQAVELRGASMVSTSGDDRAVLVSLLWRPLADPGPEPRLFFHLLDGSGRPRGQAHFSARPQYAWDPARLASDGLVSWFLVPLDGAAPPGDYRVAVGLSATLGGAALAAEASSARLLTDRVLLGTATLGPRSTPPPSRSLAMDRVEREMAAGIQLMGYRLDRHEALPGEVISLSLFWKALRSGLPDYAVSISLAETGTAADSDAPAPPGTEAYPTSHWRTGEIVEERRELRLPARQAPGGVEILVAVHGATVGRGEHSFPITRLIVLERPRSFALPNLPCCLLGARLGSLATLEAIHLNTPLAEPGLWRARPGESIEVSLYWRALGESDRSYKVFLHLVSDQGAVAAQHDSPPALGAQPTTGWVRDEVITDLHPLALPLDLAPGRYRLVAGLYDEATSQRLPTGLPGDALGLGSILVGAP